MRRAISGLWGILLLATGAVCGADFPEFGDAWVLDGPYTKEGLKGKAVVLYFYEEGCPGCRARWPGLLELRKQFENEPVLFVAVNSGNSKSSVESYAKSVNSNWAHYVDTDRSFEKKAIGMEISLQNIFQALVADADGNVRNANAQNLGPAVKDALGGAKWKIDPAEVPETLKKAWRMFEFGRIGDAAPLVKQALAASDAKTKATAQKLEAVIKENIAKRLESAKAAVDAGDKWAGYKHYDAVATIYKDFPEARAAASELGKLRGDAKVSKEVQAKTMLDQIKTMLASPLKPQQEQGRQGLEALIVKFPDTEAGETAKTMKK